MTILWNTCFEGYIENLHCRDIQDSSLALGKKHNLVSQIMTAEIIVTDVTR